MSKNKSQKNRLYSIVFEADTSLGKVFDITIIVFILLSIAAVMLESVDEINKKYHTLFFIAEWIITVLFTIEYILRVVLVKKPLNYIFSFYGIIDILSVIPSYIGLFVTGSAGLGIIRVLRLLRIFRILKLSRYVKESNLLMRSLLASRTKLSVFMSAILTIVIIIGTIMYLVEGGENGFTSIPRSIYWAIVTLTTVGYGDIAPVTSFGQLLASVVMLTGYAIIAVPMGIISSEIVNQSKLKPITTQVCQNCLKEDHDREAKYCKYCGTALDVD